MPNPPVIEMKRDRRGGWNRNAPIRELAPTLAVAPAQDPITFINRLTHTKGAFAGQTFARIAPAGKAADFQPERRRVVVLAKLDADAILAVVVEGAVVLAAAESYRVFDLLHRLANRIDLVSDSLEHHRRLSAFDDDLL